MKLTTHLHVVEMIGVNEAIPLLLLYAFMACSGQLYLFYFNIHQFIQIFSPVSKEMRFVQSKCESFSTSLKNRFWQHKKNSYTIHTHYISYSMRSTILLRHEIYLKCSILNAMLKGQNCRPTSIQSCHNSPSFVHCRTLCV